MKRLLSSLFIIASFAAIAHAGTCPIGANYISLSSPATNGFFGSVTLGSGSATPSAITSCVYSDPAAGSDANTGADEAHPFQFVKGMANCASNCAAVTTAATTAWIIKGGGTYHRSSGTPLMGGVWAVPAFGYVGIDPTWFTGGSFARPIVNMDNPLNTSLVASCSFDDGAATNINAMSLSGSTVFDGIEFTGACSSSNGANGGAYIVMSGSGNVVERTYGHGWTELTTSADDRFFGVEGSGNNRYLYIIIDGQDSSLGTACTTAGCVASMWDGVPSDAGTGATGWAMGDCTDTEFSIIRHVSQVCQATFINIWHDNLAEYFFEPAFGSPCCRHGNGLEGLTGTTSSATPELVYNNTFRNFNEGVGVWLSADIAYVFNNIWGNDGHATPDPNCLMMSPDASGDVGTITVTNNTMDNTCGSGAVASPQPVYGVGSSFIFQNNHVINRLSIFGSSALWACGTGNSCTNKTDNGGEIFQTTAVANGQGYTLANNYAPTLITNATVGAGTNLSSSCSTYSADSSLCSGSGAGVSEVSGWGGMIVSYPAITINVRPTTWDAGAYQFSPAVVTPAPAPTFAKLNKGKLKWQPSVQYLFLPEPRLPAQLPPTKTALLTQ